MNVVKNVPEKIKKYCVIFSFAFLHSPFFCESRPHSNHVFAKLDFCLTVLGRIVQRATKNEGDLGKVGHPHPRSKDRVLGLMIEVIIEHIALLRLKTFGEIYRGASEQKLPHRMVCLASNGVIVMFTHIGQIIIGYVFLERRRFKCR